MSTCLEYGEERIEKCSETEDQGYNECTQTKDQGYKKCCKWKPCSWFCKAWTWISNIVCVLYTWVSKIVCVAVTVITTSVCVAWDIVTTVVNVVLVTLESSVGWALSAMAFLIELAEMIPVLGTIIRYGINGLSHVIIAFVSLGDTLLGLLGIRPEKKLRICTVILRDEDGVEVVQPMQVVPLLQLAADIYKRDANVRLIPSQPFQYSTGFKTSNAVNEDWIITEGSGSDSDTLDVPCNAKKEIGLGGSKFQLKSSTRCFFGSWRRVVGYGAPVSCFIIRESLGDSIGCSLVFPDYITVDKQAIQTSPRTIGHEIGHSCLLLHECVNKDASNLMATKDACDPTSATEPDRITPKMDTWQILSIRASKHVTYF